MKPRARRRRDKSLLKARAIKTARRMGLRNVSWDVKNVDNPTGRRCWCCSNPRKGNGSRDKTRQELRADDAIQ